MVCVAGMSSVVAGLAVNVWSGGVGTEFAGGSCLVLEWEISRSGYMSFYRVGLLRGFHHRLIGY
ncbi:hypothetical protein KC19_12G046700 [Ceratodon purpureus]|uniref:Secreted protein n=1 Tax=Ceratodon purpureus TaxID=3225 RepID=A0A8T0G3M1_CERPU|nr:hypothetical protein KC19_12G046700 [Ceratodon purpureus]